MVGLEDEPIVSPEPSEPTLSGAATFERMLLRAQREGVMSEFDTWFLRKLAQGESIETLATARETRRALGSANLSKKMVEGYMEALRTRIDAFVASLA
jgi:hypothetical protein